MIDLYLNSAYYAAEDEISLERKRQSANLLILVDQFEEFFTNPENFFNDVHSKDAQVVVNLLLETARIAISRNLPVYVVCTMRSDYIGQCSTFRGLPEYIGFSQFFVPRLKRKDLKQVIEEPAILSGNRITQRLIERLVYDLADGVDQLPILQHALSRSGRLLIMVVRRWISCIMQWWAECLLTICLMAIFISSITGLMLFPKHNKNCMRKQDCIKIIEIHASQLYENAADEYNQELSRKPCFTTGGEANHRTHF